MLSLLKNSVSIPPFGTTRLPPTEIMMGGSCGLNIIVPKKTPDNRGIFLDTLGKNLLTTGKFPVHNMVYYSRVFDKNQTMRYNGSIRMRRSRITITLQQQTLNAIDKLIDRRKIRNRSHAIEYILNQYLKPNIGAAVILAGGKGTKLRPYTYEIPSALLPIQGHPLLEYTLKNLKDNQILNVILCIGYLGDKIKKHFGNGEKFGVHITYLQERSPLQTGGALLHAKSLLANQQFLVIHGDTLSNLDLRDFINFHNDYNMIATIALTTNTQPKDFGQLTLHGIRLVNFYQNTKKSEIKSHLINCGMYVFQPELFQYLPKDKSSFFLEDVIEQLIKQKKVNGFVFEGQWFDVGDPDNYEKAIKEFSSHPIMI